MTVPRILVWFCLYYRRGNANREAVLLYMGIAFCYENHLSPSGKTDIEKGEVRICIPLLFLWPFDAYVQGKRYHRKSQQHDQRPGIAACGSQ